MVSDLRLHVTTFTDSGRNGGIEENADNGENALETSGENLDDYRKCRWIAKKAQKLEKTQMTIENAWICKLDTLECRKKQQSLILLFKCIRNIGPKYISDFFSIRETSYNLRGNDVNLCVPKFNLNFMRNSFNDKYAQQWNKFPEDVKLADNVNILKSKLKSIQL